MAGREGEGERRRGERRGEAATTMTSRSISQRCAALQLRALALYALVQLTQRRTRSHSSVAFDLASSIRLRVDEPLRPHRRTRILRSVPSNQPPCSHPAAARLALLVRARRRPSCRRSRPPSLARLAPSPSSCFSGQAEGEDRVTAGLHCGVLCTEDEREHGQI